MAGKNKERACVGKVVFEGMVKDLEIVKRPPPIPGVLDIVPLDKRTYSLREPVQASVNVIASGGRTAIVIFIGSEIVNVDGSDLVSLKIDGNDVKL